MTKEDMLRLTQAQLDAYNARDLDAFCACFHAQVKIHPLSEGRVTTEGLALFRAGYEKLFNSSPKLHCELRSRMVLGETVLDEEWVTGAAKYPQGLHAVAIYGFRDGLIDRVWFAR